MPLLSGQERCSLVGAARNGEEPSLPIDRGAAIRSGFTLYYRSIFDTVRDFLHDEVMEGHEKILQRYVKPDLLIGEYMEMKQLPKRSGEYLFDIIMRRHELRSTMMTSNRPSQIGVN